MAILYCSGSNINDVTGKLRTDLAQVQALAYEKQGRAIAACLVTKFRGYRRVKSHTPPSK